MSEDGTPAPQHTEIAISPAPLNSNQPLVHRSNADKLQFIAGAEDEGEGESKPAGQQGFKERVLQLVIQARAIAESRFVETSLLVTSPSSISLS